MPGPTRDAPAALRPLDPVALRRAVQRLQAAPHAPWLHGEVARRMAERLAVFKQRPDLVIDWWSHLGASHALLRQACPDARVVAAEADEVRRAATEAGRRGAWWALHRHFRREPVVLTEGGIGDGQARLLWSNMTLHGCIDPLDVMRRWHRALAVDGILLFSTLGPGSLAELRDVYRERHWGDAHAPFVDMHDLGDMLVQAGFADPVMDQETITLTWSSGEALLDELRSLGANVSPRRFGGLRTPRWRQALASALQAGADAAGRVPMRFEVVYGHAFKPATRPRVAPTTVIAADDMRSLLRRAGK